MLKLTSLVTRSALIILLTGFAPGCCDQDSIPKFIEQLNSSVTRDRNQAALDLANCGSKAEKAVPRLSELLYDESKGVQSSASYALRKIDTPEARAIMSKIEANRR